MKIIQSSSFCVRTVTPVCFMYYLCFHATMAKLSYLDRNYGPQRLKYFLSGPLWNTFACFLTRKMEMGKNSIALSFRSLSALMFWELQRRVFKSSAFRGGLQLPPPSSLSADEFAPLRTKTKSIWNRHSSHPPHSWSYPPMPWPHISLCICRFTDSSVWVISKVMVYPMPVIPRHSMGQWRRFRDDTCQVRCIMSILGMWELKLRAVKLLLQDTSVSKSWCWQRDPSLPDPRAATSLDRRDLGSLST